MAIAPVSHSATAGPWKRCPTPVEADGLLAQLLAANSPAGLPGYLAGPAPAGDIPQPLFGFDINGSGVQCYCATCGIDEKFGNGVLGWYPDGWLRSVGWRCANSTYKGTDYAQRVTRMREADRRRARETGFVLVAPLIAPMLKELNLLRYGSILQDIAVWMAALRKKAEPLHRKLLQNVANSSGELQIVRRLAQARRVGGRVEHYEAVRFAALRGAGALSLGPLPRQNLDIAAERLQTVVTTIRTKSFSALSDKDQKHLITVVNQVSASLSETVNAIESALQFFERDNIGAIARWIEAQPEIGGKLKPARNGWRWIDDRVDHVFEVKHLQPRTLLPLLPAFQRALRGAGA